MQLESISTLEVFPKGIYQALIKTGGRAEDLCTSYSNTSVWDLPKVQNECEYLQKPIYSLDVLNIRKWWHKTSCVLNPVKENEGEARANGGVRSFSMSGNWPLFAMRQSCSDRGQKTLSSPIQGKDQLHLGKWPKSHLCKSQKKKQNQNLSLSRQYSAAKQEGKDVIAPKIAHLYVTKFNWHQGRSKQLRLHSPCAIGTR